MQLATRPQNNICSLSPSGPLARRIDFWLDQETALGAALWELQDVAEHGPARRIAAEIIAALTIVRQCRFAIEREVAA